MEIIFELKLRPLRDRLQSIPLVYSSTFMYSFLKYIGVLMIEYFDLDSIYQKNDEQRFIKKVINSRGASGQKVVQLMDTNENVELKSDKKVINYCTETLRKHKNLFTQIELLSNQYLAGSMAYVFKAKITGIENWVAIKVLRKDIEEKIEKRTQNFELFIKKPKWYL